MSLFDLSDLPGVALQTGSYTATRSAVATYGTDGRLIPGSTSTFSIKASVQPLNGRDLLRLPEGERTTERRKVYSPTRLFVAGAGQDADLLTIDGTPYQVETSETWGAAGNYWKMVVRSVARRAP